MESNPDLKPLNNDLKIEPHNNEKAIKITTIESEKSIKALQKPTQIKIEAQSSPMFKEGELARMNGNDIKMHALDVLSDQQVD